MRILAAIEDPVVARKIRDSLGLPSRPPRLLPLAGTHNAHSPNSDGEPAAFADVCFNAGWLRSGLTIAAFKSVCAPKNSVRPEKFFFRTSQIRFMRPVAASSPIPTRDKPLLIFLCALDESVPGRHHH
jgi:hypothetical protein